MKSWLKSLSRAHWPLFERQFLGNARQRLFSTLDEPGLEALAARIRPYHRQLAKLSARAKAEPAALLELALAVAHRVDQDDVRAQDIRLREVPISETHVPSKILRVLLETLLPSDKAQYVLETQVGASNRGSGHPNIVAAFAFIDLLLEKDEIDEAVSLAERLASTFSGPAPLQYYLYQGIRRKNERGEVSNNPAVCVEDLTTRFCAHPFQTLSTRSDLRYSKNGPLFQVYACSCPALLPYPVSANAADQSPDEIWNGAAIQEIRRSILDGDFTYCGRMLCSELLQGKLPSREEVTDPGLRDIIDNRRVVVAGAPTSVMLAHDSSCNLACPSCRKELQVIKNETRIFLDRFAENTLIPLLNDASVHLIISGDGDPFGSKHYRKLIYSLDPARHANVRLTLLTNGLLFTTREWEALGWRQRLIASVLVSIDAAQKETYEDVRRPGKWDTIMTNMEMLGSLRKEGAIPSLGIQFVVQQKNYREMADFIRLGEKWNVDTVSFQRLVSMGSMEDPEEFASAEVCQPCHSEHLALLEMLSDPIFTHPIVQWGAVDPVFKKALELRRQRSRSTADASSKEVEIA